MHNAKVEMVFRELTADRIEQWTSAMKGFKPLSFEQMKIMAREKGHLYSQFKDIYDFFKTHKDLPSSQLVRIIRDRQKALGFRPNCNLWKLNGIRQFLRTYENVEEPSISKLSSPQHRAIRDMIHELGQLQGYISEREYPFNHWYLDVVWKRIKTGIPSCVFEVQIKGDFYKATTKLKHAFDQWNCTPVLVTTEEFMEEAKRLLEVSLHEMKEKAKVIDWKNIRELYELARALRNKKQEIGL